MKRFRLFLDKVAKLWLFLQKEKVRIDNINL